MQAKNRVTRLSWFSTCPGREYLRSKRDSLRRLYTLSESMRTLFWPRKRSSTTAFHSISITTSCSLKFFSSWILIWKRLDTSWFQKWSQRTTFGGTTSTESSATNETLACLTNLAVWSQGKPEQESCFNFRKRSTKNVTRKLSLTRQTICGNPGKKVQLRLNCKSWTATMEMKHKIRQKGLLT